MSRSAVTQRLRITSDPISSSYFVKLCLSDTFKQLDLPLVVFTCKYSVFTVCTCKKAVPRHAFKEPPNNACRNHYSCTTVQSLREPSQLCFFYSHMLSTWNTQWLFQVCTCIRKMFNLVLKNLRSGQTSPLLLQGLVTTSISFRPHYFAFLCWTGHTSWTKSLLWLSRTLRLSLPWFWLQGWGQDLAHLAKWSMRRVTEAGE